MGWTERQQRLLRGMGYRVLADPATVPGQDGSPPASPLGEGGGAARAAQREEGAAVFAPPDGIAASPRDAASTSSLDVASMDWAALRAAVAACRACGLCESRRNTVFGVGHEQAHWMVVGEAPGEQEDARGEPFVGAAGQLLDAMLAALGLTRGEAPPARQVFIANTLKCRPPANRNPQPQELQRCAPFLVRQLELVRPRVVLAMGRFAVQSLLASDAPIGQLRGRVHAWRGVPLVVTYHPAYLLRNPADKARAWDDLCLANEVASRAEAGPGG